MKNYVNILFKKIVLASFVGSFGLSLVAQEIEEVVVTAESVLKTSKIFLKLLLH